MAIFMVLSALSTISFLLADLSYTTQVHQSIAVGSFRQLQAHYLAMSALKISLIRLKAFQGIKKNLEKLQASQFFPIDGIWKTPFSYPPPLSMLPKGATEVQTLIQSSFLKGNYTSEIHSEDGKFNLNLLSDASLMETDIEKEFEQYLEYILEQEFAKNPNLPPSYQQFIPDLKEGILGQLSHQPFYSMSQLHLLKDMDEDLYLLLEPYFTVRPLEFKRQINVNSFHPLLLKVWIPEMSEEEIKTYETHIQTNPFSQKEDFFNFLEKNVAHFQTQSDALHQFKEQISEKKIELTTEEKHFKIIATGQIHQANVTMTVWVSLNSVSPSPPVQLETNQVPVGLRITGMNIK